MGKSGPSAQGMRNGQNKERFAGNRKGQADRGEASGGVAADTKTAPRRAKESMASHYARGGSEKGETALWEMRCPELDLPAWTRRIGPKSPFAAARIMAEAIDHDNARIMAFGGKSYILEMRLYGQTRVTQIEICGYPVWKYSACAIGG